MASSRFQSFATVRRSGAPRAWPLAVALALYGVLVLALIWRVPLGAAPDERAHGEYVAFIVANRALPVFEGQPPPNPGYEFHQPPLYYLLAAPGWAVMPSGSELLAGRLLSLVLGLLTLVLIWRTARLALPNRPEVAAAATILAALWPWHQSVGAVAGNDSLAGLVCAALFFQGTRALCRSHDEGSAQAASQSSFWRGPALWIGILTGLGLWTKTTCLPVALAALGALLLASRSAESGAAARFDPGAVRAMGLAFGAAVIVALPVLARNAMLYGDPLALGAFSGAAAAASPGYVEFASIGIGFGTYARGMLWMIALTAWGFYGGPDTASRVTSPLGSPRLVPGDEWLWLLLVPCLVAPFVAMLGWRRLKWDEAQWTRARAWALFWFAGVALVVMAWMRFALDHFAGGQARYLHPALVPVVIGLSLGWSGWPRAMRWGLGAVVIGTALVLTLLNLLVWRTLV